MRGALIWVGMVILTGLTVSGAGAQELLTVAEKSDFKATSKHAEVIDYCERLARMSPVVRLSELGVTTEGRKLPLVILADPPLTTPAEAAKSGKLVLFVMGNIHAGEVDGKEGLLMLMRDLALARERPLLQDAILLIVPNFNADGGDRFDRHRPEQNGPEIVGTRQNAQGFDLNRDFIKLESPEVRALVRLFSTWDPAIFIDAHTTNGSYHNHIMTYDSPRHAALDARLVTFGHEVFLPGAGKLLTRITGNSTNYYGNFEKNKTIWEPSPALPRFGTQYAGFRHRIGILSETYVYASYRDRVLNSRDFARSCFEYAVQNKDKLRQVLKDAEASAADRKLSLRCKLAPLKTITMIGVENGKTAPPGTTKEYSCEYLGKSVSTLTIDRPYAYLVPASYPRVRENLLNHGIQVETLTENTELNAEVYRIDRITTAEEEFQKHKLQELEVTPRKEKIMARSGMLLVRTQQPLGVLVSYLLEPQAEDGLAAWNFFDAGLKSGGDFPVLRVPVETRLSTQPVKP